MSVAPEHPETYLTIGIKLLNLEHQKSEYGDETPENVSRIYEIEAEIKAAITKQDAIPRRSRDVIVAEIEKYRSMRAIIESNRAAVTARMRLLGGDIMDAARLSSPSEKRKLDVLARMITVLTSELNRD